jgi:CspA family cold shock protein
MAEGTVKWFNGAKGYGFVAPADGSKDLFVHQNNLADGATSLPEGARVSFEARKGEKGPEAINVALVP